MGEEIVEVVETVDAELVVAEPGRVGSASEPWRRVTTPVAVGAAAAVTGFAAGVATAAVVRKKIRR